MSEGAGCHSGRATSCISSRLASSALLQEVCIHSACRGVEGAPGGSYVYGIHVSDVLYLAHGKQADPTLGSGAQLYAT